MTTIDAESRRKVVLLAAAAGARYLEWAARKDQRPPDEEAENTYDLPDGDDIAGLLRAFFARQAAEVLGTIPTIGEPLPEELPDLEHWDRPMAGAFTPLISAYWDTAGQEIREKIGLEPDAWPSSWDVKDVHLKAKIESAAFNFCQSTNATTTQTIGNALESLRAELVAGVFDRGESVAELTRRVNGVFDTAEQYRARRIGATEASRAVHAAGYESVVESGVVVGTRWLLSANSCPLCKRIAADVNQVKLGEAFAVIGDNPHYSEIRYPPAHPTCCLPETPIVAPIGVAGVKAQYDGPVVRIDFAEGGHVTVTPNHMLLTPTGFARADSLVQGCDVLRYLETELPTSRNPDDHREPTTIEEVFDAWSVSLGVSSAHVPVSPEYLHGDAALCQGDIDVVTPYGLLGNDFDTEAVEPSRERFLLGSDVFGMPLQSLRDLTSMLFALRGATDGGMRGLRERNASLWRHPGHPDQVSLAPVSKINAGFKKSPANGRAGDPEFFGQGQFGSACPVAIDQIREVDGEPPLSPSFLHATNPDPILAQPAPDWGRSDAESPGDRLDVFSGKIPGDDRFGIKLLGEDLAGGRLAVPDCYPGLVETISDESDGHVENLGDGTHRFPGFVSGDDILGVDFLGAKPDSFGDTSHLDSAPQESIPDGREVDARRIGEVLRRFPGKVAACKILDVEIQHYSGPVYDVETATSLYLIGDGIVSSNCRCSTEAILHPDYSGPESPEWGTTLEQPTTDED